MRVGPISVMVCGFVATASGPSRAATPKDACVKSFEDGQVQRQQSKLVEAEDAFRFCARSDCPAVVSTKCGEWLAEVDRAVPTVVFAAQVDGSDTTDVRVLDRGRILASRLDGRAVPMNPGEHALRFEHPGATAVERTVVLREGEKQRAVAVAFSAKAVATPTPTPSEAPEGEGRTVPTVTWVFGGVGLVAIGSFAYFGLSALDRSSTLRDTCAPACAASDVTEIKTRNTVSAVSLGVALISLGAAAYFFFSAPPGRENRAGLDWRAGAVRF
jgi:hypothetical protein